MLDPASPLPRAILWLALAASVAWLVVRAVWRDRREYARFKRYRSTRRRQAMLRKWLRESLLVFGGLSAGMLVLVGGHAEGFVRELATWPVVREVRDWAGENAGFAVGAVVGSVLGVVALTLLGMRAVRAEGDEPATVGDIRALLPRNRQELGIGALMSLNAGLVEELLFRLALPTLLFVLSGSTAAAVVVSVIIFGALHAYQGVAGIVGSTVIGALLIAVLAVTGSIVWPIVLHAVFNLRSLVLLPMLLHGVHRIDGRAQPYGPPRPRPNASAS